MKAAKVCLALLFAPATVGLVSLTGCGSAPETETQKVDLAEEGSQSLVELERDHPELKTTIDNSYGYAIFPNIAKGGLVVEGGSGRGDVYEQNKYIGTAHLTLANIGVTIGAETYTELLIFQTKAAEANFENNALKFDATASAVALKAGVASQPVFTNGVAVITKTLGGLEADASIGGQQFTFTPAQITPTTVPSAPNP
jgi:lipid-binding SYLF domain-containing protein